MTTVIPAVLTHSAKELQEKLSNERMRALAPMWQIDVLDGSMFHANCFADPSAVADISDLPDIELHLMIQNPLPVIDAWSPIAPVKRAIIHAEISRPIGAVIDRIKAAGMDVGLAVDPETSVMSVKEFMHRIDFLLIMGVHPGASGQAFLGERILNKIRHAKIHFPDLKIAVDGGVTLENAAGIVNAGAEILCTASALWKADDIEAAYHSLSQL